MKRIVGFCVLFILSFSHCEGQQLTSESIRNVSYISVDSLLNEFQDARNQNAVFQRLVALQNEPDGPKVNEKYAEILHRSIQFARENGQYIKSLPLINRLADYYIYKSPDLTKASKLLEEFKPYINSIKDRDDLLYYYVLLTETDVFNNNFDKALVTADKGLSIAGNKIDSLNRNVAYLLLKKGEINFKKGNALESLEYFNSARDLFTLQKDTLYIMWSLNGQASLYESIGLNDSAEQEREKLFALGSKEEYNDVLAIARLSSSLNYGKKGDIVNEMIHLKEAVKLANSSENLQTIIKILTYSSMVTAYANQSNIDSSNYYFNILESHISGNENNPFLSVYYQFARANISFCNGNLKDAENILKQNESLIISENYQMKMRMDLLLSKIYSRMGKHKKALNHYKEFSTLRDSVYTADQSRKVLFLQDKFDSAKKDIEIESQKNRLQNLELSLKNRVIETLFLFFLLIGLFAVIYFYRSRKYTDKVIALKDSFTQNLIEAQENERSNLARELHDGVAQDLIHIKNRLTLDGDDESIKLLENSLKEIRSISQGLHPIILQKFGLSEGLKYWINNLDQVNSIFFEVDIDDVQYIFSQKQQLHIYRIVQEAINNAVKHSESPTIKVSVKKYPKSIIIRVQDFGKGFEYKKLKGEAANMGMKIMQERSLMIPANLTINATNNNTTIQLKYDY